MYPPGGPTGRQPEINLDDLIKQIKGAFSGVTGKFGRFGFGGFLVFGALIIAAIYLGSGVYTINPGEQAVLRLFGAAQGNPVTQEGLHWWWPSPVGKKNVVLTTETRRMELGFVSTAGGGTAAVPVESLMISGDLNIVDVQMVIQYTIKDLSNYLFKVNDPGEPERGIEPGSPDGKTLKDASEAALRLVIGQSSIDDVITEQRARVESETRLRLQEILDIYQTGINVVNVKLQDVKAPEEVQDAFQDVLRARQERDTKENQALAYKNDIIPRANGSAEQIIREAEAFKESRIATSEGEAARFESILNEYYNSKEVTRQRLYLEAMEEILPGISKVIVSPDAETVLILGENNKLTPIPLTPNIE